MGNLLRGDLIDHFDGKLHDVLLNIYEIALPQLREESNSETCHSNAVSILIPMASRHQFAVAIIETCLEKLLFEAYGGSSGALCILEVLTDTITSRDVWRPILRQRGEFPLPDRVALMMAYTYA